jgi:hypothetical protein
MKTGAGSAGQYNSFHRLNVFEKAEVLTAMRKFNEMQFSANFYYLVLVKKLALLACFLFLSFRQENDFFPEAGGKSC